MPPAESLDLPPEPATIDYVARWAEIIERRRAQMDAAYAASGITSDDYWGKRAKSYKAATHASTPQDPILARVLGAVTRQSTVIDAGAGTGRHTLAIAPHVAHVTAVDPSPAMLGLLREEIAEQAIRNITPVDAGWMDADIEPADVVLCSHVLYPIKDVVPFVRRLESKARERLFVYIRADPLPTDFGLWSEFYGAPLQGQPTHADLFNVLVQIGVMANVEIVTAPFTWKFDSLEDAAGEVGGRLCLRPDDEPSQAKLRDVLASRFQRESGGIMSDSGEARSAIFSWHPSH
ncbi:MAG TPA: class I SAM-dependent methyltransferase [Dehalococcoidia bacterium]|jgi:SAM-dependent methyltransferase